MTAALLDRTPQTRAKSPPGLRLLVLARIACEEGASRGELLREIGPYAGDENATRLAVERELAQLIRDSQAIELKARFTASPDGVVGLLGELGLKALPGTWVEMLEVRLVAKALGIEREPSARLKVLGKPDVLRAEVLIHGYGLQLRGTASATRVRAALALIALEREASLDDYADSGQRLDARVSGELLLAIFHPTSPLHDGALVVQQGRLTAAKVFLPLSLSREVSRFYGTRHRAAIGLTEETDAVVIIVSEERGTVGVVVAGEVIPVADANELRLRLLDFFHADARRPAGSPA